MARLKSSAPTTQKLRDAQGQLPNKQCAACHLWWYSASLVPTVCTKCRTVPERRQHTVASLELELKRLGYNMLDCKLTAERALENPSKEYAELKRLSHASLIQGRDNMIAGRNHDANSNFAFAYQMRCTSDWIWKNLLHRQGDLGHAKFLEVSREFSKLAGHKLTGEQKARIAAKVAAIHE
eukprot:CAMPEP_0175913398 /NCGR_PEP_ID=MMETSP0108-20121206/9245_1 /TAXON_ID=195067 ORGANISM="Goniomonas pacifica, Strain CCMP1869" /NCGR_SAMPLE_ID=MMETSP0108 /ASSEMBLY_ACC=CAM_ASM_000204 /LENGTH=180 /DNA_ID=CAMNT_0017235787 /DNA_START=98 /DNA_END=640 /DNA_ORIENTATION=-